MSKRQPWAKWFFSDWRAEPRLKLVSRAARSLWLDMLGLAHESETPGFVRVGNLSLVDAAQIARVLGDTEAEIAPLLAELECAGVFSRVGDPALPADVAALVPASMPERTILSRKMLRDHAKAVANRKNGAKGGNPSLKADGITRGLTDGLSQGVKAQKPEARVQLLRNCADAPGGKSQKRTGARSEPVDAKTWLFTDGLQWLSKATGRAEGALRSQLGRWLRDAKEDAPAIRTAFEAAQDQGELAEPVAWITAALKARAQAAIPFEPTDAHGWRQRFKAFKEHGAWPSKWGGTKPGDDPRHPAALLTEFGFSHSGAA